MTLIAKPVVKDQYWIITDGKEKVGNVQSQDGGYDLVIKGSRYHFNDTTDLANSTQIIFDNTLPTVVNNLTVKDYPVKGRTYNVILDVRRQLQLYTKTQKSKCYYAMGYFAVQLNGANNAWQRMLCPKYIFLQRYKYMGPYLTSDECDRAINTV
jgi:hypothetical protein